MKAKETERQYPHRLDKFLTFICLEVSIPNNSSKNGELHCKKIERLFFISQKISVTS